MTRNDEKNPASGHERTLERHIIARHFSDSDRASPPDPEKSVELEQVEKGGELLFVFPDGDRHERRVQRAVISSRDRLFWVTLTIACGQPGSTSTGDSDMRATLAKEYGYLAKARNDLDSFYEFYRPMMVGDPHLVGAVPGLGKSAGYFGYAERLDNPDVGQVLGAVHGIQDWLDVNQHDPEYESFQFNFCFSGHGDVDDDGTASIVVANQKLRGSDIAALICLAVPEFEVAPSVCRLDLYLDCCHAGAIAQSIARNLARLQWGTNTDAMSRIALGQVYLACLDDEEAFEINGLSNSVFSFAFLNEFSRKAPEGADKLNIGLRDVGRITEGGQHPLLLDYTSDRGVAFYNPSLVNLRRFSPELRQSIREFDPLDAEQLAVDPIGEYLRAARDQRNKYLDLEKDDWPGGEPAKPFSREGVVSIPFVF